VLKVNLMGVVNAAHAFAPGLAQARRGTMLFLASIAGQIGSQTDPPYSAAKAGLIGFTKTLALELGKFGVTANAIAPGFVETEMTMATAARQGLDYEEWKSAIARDIPLGRIGRPEDIAAVASFLCREEAGYVSGQVIYVNGGART